MHKHHLHYKFTLFFLFHSSHQKLFTFFFKDVFGFSTFTLLQVINLSPILCHWSIALLGFDMLENICIITMNTYFPTSYFSVIAKDISHYTAYLSTYFQLLQKCQYSLRKGTVVGIFLYFNVSCATYSLTPSQNDGRGLNMTHDPIECTYVFA